MAVKRSFLLIFILAVLSSSMIGFARAEPVTDPFIDVADEMFGASNEVLTYREECFELNVTVPSFVSLGTPSNKKPSTLDIYLKKVKALSGFFSVSVEAGIKIKVPIVSLYLFVDVDVKILSKDMYDLFRPEWPIWGIPTEVMSLESGDVGVYALVVPVKVAEVELGVLPMDEWRHIGSYDLYVVEEPKLVAFGIAAENVTIGEVMSLEPTVVPTYVELLEDYDELNTTHYELLGIYNSLNSSYSSLQINYTALNTAYISLKSNYESALGELNTTRSMMYVFIITTIAFITTTVYLARRKPKAV